jgi:uncharacterized glyoxalase superfamily protein PhnB
VTRILAIMPVLKVVDLGRSIAWYTNVLGFRAGDCMAQDGGGENCFLRAGDTELLLTTGSHLGGPPAFTGTLYFRVAAVDDLFARVSGRPEVVWPLEQQEYGTREFGVRDPDGYLLAFAEPSECDPAGRPG